MKSTLRSSRLISELMQSMSKFSKGFTFFMCHLYLE